MFPSTKAEALSYFDTVWAQRPEHDIGLLIIEYLSNHTSAKTIPISVFFEVAKPCINTNEQKEFVLSIVNYLSGNDLHLLTAEVELIEDDIYHLAPDEVLAAYSALINPRTGEYDSTLKEKLFLCFTPSLLAQKILGK